MNRKTKLIVYLIIYLVLVHLTLVVGCGKNPVLSILTGGGNVTVGIGKL